MAQPPFPALMIMIFALGACNGHSDSAGDNDTGSDKESDTGAGDDTDSVGDGETDKSSDGDTDTGGGGGETDTGDGDETDTGYEDGTDSMVGEETDVDSEGSDSSAEAETDTGSDAPNDSDTSDIPEQGTDSDDDNDTGDSESDDSDATDTSTAPDMIDIFDDTEVREFHLVFEQADWAEQLRDSAIYDRDFPAEEDVHTYVQAASFSLGDTVVHDVGVRYRGRSPKNWDYPDNSSKPSIRLKFNEYVKGQTFFGFKKLNFRNNNYDPSWLKEKVVFDILSEYTVSVRTAHVKMFINGEDFGLYLLIENIDGDYLENQFGEGEHGDLFKCEEFGIEMLTTDPLPSYIRKTNEDDVTPEGEAYDYTTDPKTNLVAALEVLNAPDVTLAELAETFDLEAFSRFLAINNFFVNFDSYMGRGHNYYLYQRASDSRFMHLAWDMNTTFSGMVNPRIITSWNPLEQLVDWYEDGDTGRADELSPYWSIEAEIDGIPLGPYMPYSRKILEEPELLTAFRTFYRRFLDEEFTQGRWDERIDAIKQRISPYIEADTHALYPVAVSLDAMEDFLPGGYDAIGPDGPPREGIRQWGKTRYQFLIDNYPELAAE